MKKILVVNNYDSFVYNLIQIIVELNYKDFDIVFNDKIDLFSINKYTDIIISPGPGLPNSAGKLMQLLSNSIFSHNILGVCLGHQAIAQYFGCKLAKYPVPLHAHCCNLKYINKKSLLWRGINKNIQVGLYSSWHVSDIKFSDELIITSLYENYIMSIEHKYLPIYGLQFHPESYITNFGKKIIKNFLSLT